MTDIYTLAGVQIDGAQWHGLGAGLVTSSGSVEKPVVGGTPPREKVRDGKVQFSLTGTIAAELGGIDAVMELERHTKEAIPTLVMRGGLVQVGWFEITNVDSKGSSFSGASAKVFEVSVTLESCPPGDKQQMTPVLTRMRQRLFA